MAEIAAASAAGAAAQQATSMAEVSANADKENSQTSTTSLTGAIGKTMGKEDFLKLLVTQLRYQDPMSPEDPKDFVAQLAQFSSLEQQMNTNQSLQDLGKVFESLTQAQNMAQGVSLLGKTVSGGGNQITVAGGKATTASFTLPTDAKELLVGIFDTSENQVRILDMGAQPAGKVTLAWDGKDGQGKTAADGIYTYQVAAQDTGGKAIEVDNYFSGKVQEVYQDSQGVWVIVDGRQVLLENIASVVGEP
ncbi:MAG: flagellar hook assembly protein FlgD [Thermodesulfobacteriota bacterium]